MLHGIDISSWQDPTPLLAGFDFVWVRATYCTTPDALYPVHVAHIRAAGKPLMAYCFGTVHASGIAQARATIGVVGDDVHVLALDMEPECHDVDWAPEPVWDEMSDDEGRAFIAEAQRLGYTVGLYHSRSGWPGDLGQDFNWVASWGRLAPSMPWLFWQNRGSPLDLDVFNGDLDDLHAFVMEAPMSITLIKGEDWMPGPASAPQRRPVRDEPERTNEAIVGYIEPGAVVRTIAEGLSADGNVWRLTEYNGQPGWLLRSDFSPVVQGGDPAVDAPLHAYIERTPDPTPYGQADLDAEHARTKAAAIAAVGAI